MFDHVARRSPKEEEHAIEVGGHHPPPLVERDVGKPGAAAAHTGVGEHRVDTPTGEFNRCGEAGFDGRLIGRVDNERMSRDAKGTQIGLSLLVLLRTAAPHDDVGPGLRAGPANAEPDTTVPAGDQHGAS